MIKLLKRVIAGIVGAGYVPIIFLAGGVEFERGPEMALMLVLMLPFGFFVSQYPGTTNDPPP